MYLFYYWEELFLLILDWIVVKALFLQCIYYCGASNIIVTFIYIHNPETLHLWSCTSSTLDVLVNICRFSTVESHWKWHIIVLIGNSIDSWHNCIDWELHWFMTWLYWLGTPLIHDMIELKAVHWYDRKSGVPNVQQMGTRCYYLANYMQF